MAAARSLLISFLLSGFTILAQQPRLVLPIGHTGDIYSIDYSPDGKYIVTTAGDNTAKIWDSRNAKLLIELIDPKHSFLSASFSSDGRFVITAMFSGLAKIWNAKSGDLVSESIKHESPLHNARFNSKDEYIVSSSCRYDSTIRIWSAPDGKYLNEIKGYIDELGEGALSTDGNQIITFSHNSAIVRSLKDTSTLQIIDSPNEINSAVFTPDSKSIIIASNDGTVTIWNILTKEQTLEIKHAESASMPVCSADGSYVLTVSGQSIYVSNTANRKNVFSVPGAQFAKFSPNSLYVVTYSEKGKVQIWNAQNGKMVSEFDLSLSPLNRFNSIQFSPDSRNLAISNYKDFYIWSFVNNKIVAESRGSSSFNYSAEYAIDGEYIFTAQSNEIRVWDSKYAELLSFFPTEEEYEFSPDVKQLCIRNKDEYEVWGTGDLRLIKKYSHDNGNFVGLIHSPDWEKIAVVYGAGSIRIKDANNDKLFSSINNLKIKIRFLRFSKDSRFLLAISDGGVLHVWDTDNNNHHYTFNDNLGDIRSYDVSPDNNYILTVDLDRSVKYGTSKIWDISTGKLLRVLDSSSFMHSLAYANYDITGKYICALSDGGAAKIFNAENGAVIKEINDLSDNVKTIKFSPTGVLAATGHSSGLIKIWEVNTGKNLFEFAGHKDAISTISFSHNSDRLITTSNDNTIKIWDIKGRKLIYTFFCVDDIEYFNQIPSGHYSCTPAASKLLHYVTKDLKIVTFEQLDVKYNRPDKVLEAIGNTDTALIRSYRRAWEKRIKKLGIDTNSFRDGYSVPEADFANRDDIDYEQKNEKLELHIKGMDSTYKLDRFNVWVNETPIFGQRGISIRKKNSNRLDTSITIQLSQGENRIETSISNINATESYRIPLSVNYSPPVKQKETLRFVGIGIDQFADGKYNLQYSAKDIRDLARKLKDKYGNDMMIDTLFNQNVTVANVKALKLKLKQTTENDKVIIAYSGHGMLSKDYDYYLSTYSVNFDKPEQNGLPYDELENLLDSIPARKKLLLIDACHSGEVDKEDLVTLNKTSDSLIKGLKPVAYKKDGQLGLKNSFELMQSLFVNVGKSTGATIISAAAGTQFALERNDLKNGVFTYSILEAMNKYPIMKISELKKIVGERVEQLTKGLQKPTSRNETIAVDWQIW